ncbi:MAG: fibronectin type III domain-containing protein [Phycisphaerae bacterium]|nr:fibronectin type III domain-containing protein [Phycisphaerae bacterium]
MPKFPNREAEVVALAETMVAGLTAHAADFPSVDAVSLQAALTNYKSQRQTQEDARSQAQIATVTKDEQLDALTELMKNDLKLSEVDVADDPEKLTEIGWGPRQDPQPIVAPGSPTDLHPISEGQGTIWLKWDKPANGGGPVRNYIVERRDQQQDGSFGAWTLVQTTYNCEINLTEQPDNVRVEYRVKASNAAGESMPSNSVSVVLP